MRFGRVCSFPFLLAICFALTAFCLRAQDGGGSHGLTEVYKNPDFQITGVSVSKSGRIFVNFPRWSDMYQNAVMEVMPDGTAKPFPNDDWNKWDLQLPTAGKHFVCVQSVVVDGQDNLWVLDPAAPMLLTTVPGGPKLVKISLKTNTVTRVIPIGPGVAKPNTYLNDVRFDTAGNWAYITDSGVGGIIVVDLKSGNAHCALDGDSSVMPDKSIKITIDGKKVLGPTGETPAFHSDAIALSPDGNTLYYQSIASNTLYKVKTDALRDPNGKPKAEKAAKTFPLDGIWMDRSGNLYLSNVQAKAVSKLTPDGKIQNVVTDARLEWPDTFSQGPDGSIYITASHINQAPTYNNGKSIRKLPYQLFKFKP